MKRIFIVTGASGFLGNNIVLELSKDKENEIRVLLFDNESDKPLEGLDVKIFRGNVIDKASLLPLFDVNNDKPLYVIHCAAIVSVKTKYDKYLYEVNVDGTKNIAQLTLERNGKLIYVSSVHALGKAKKNSLIKETNKYDNKKVYGHYAKSKVIATNYVLDLVNKHNLNASIVLPSGMLGPRDYGSSHLTELIRDYASGKLKAIVKGGYDFSDVRDVAKGIINAAYLGRKGESYILSNKYVNIKELIDEVDKIINRINKIKMLPMWLAKLTAPIAELYYLVRNKPPLYTSFSLRTIDEKVYFNNEKAKQELNYKLRDLKESVVDTVNWLIKEGKITIDH